jgi:hypothetical protein
LKARIAELEGSSKEEVSSKVQLDELINVMSLLPYPLNLSTKERGQGENFRFESFGQIKRILYSKLLSIMEVHGKFLRSGYFIIMDARVVKEHGLNEAYASILTKEKIEKILTDSESALDLYKLSNTEQQKVIVTMIIEKLRDGHNLDLNIVDKISRESKVDIVGKAEEAKRLFSTDASQ